jgi:hypothetical protein
MSSNGIVYANNIMQELRYVVVIYLHRLTRAWFAFGLYLTHLRLCHGIILADGATKMDLSNQTISELSDLFSLGPPGEEGPLMDLDDLSNNITARTKLLPVSTPAPRQVLGQFVPDYSKTACSVEDDDSAGYCMLDKVSLRCKWAARSLLHMFMTKREGYPATLLRIAFHDGSYTCTYSIQSCIQVLMLKWPQGIHSFCWMPRLAFFRHRPPIIGSSSVSLCPAWVSYQLISSHA